MSDFTPINNSKEKDVEDASEAPKTPSKRKTGVQGGTPKKPKSETNTPKSGGKIIKASKIPETFDELAEEDKMMIEWREVSAHRSP
jgi:hypothetical protein